MPFETLNDDRKPVLMIGVGRQRVGKTTFLNALAQYLRSDGASFEIWDADKMNATNNMSLFHREALQPTSVDPEDVKAWLEQRFTDLVERRFDAMLDVGGGDTRSRVWSRRCRSPRRSRTRACASWSSMWSGPTLRTSIIWIGSNRMISSHRRRR